MQNESVFKQLKSHLRSGRKRLKNVTDPQVPRETEINNDEINESVYNILLITNRDSDNLGDLVIEACDISLIRTVMKNLGVPERRYRIISRAASMISRKYVATKDEQLLETAIDLIKKVDVVFFGGAPMFNYSYQIFYERTAVTLELARKYNKPVIFSAMGIEKYDENDSRCQRLKKTLNFDCVRRITTRDDFDSLQKYMENENVFISPVADPAVFSKEVFGNFVSKRKKRKKKKVGIFVLRSDGFKNNGINFSRDDAVNMWLGLIDELEKKGYDYTLLANGHFADEAFLDYLIRDYGISSKKCVINMGSPEKMIEKISIYDAVISCRLHPSIISYSLQVPSLGIIWNSKVKQFYETVGYGDRTFSITEASPEKIVSKLDEIIGTKPKRDPQFRMSVYNTMFDGLQEVLSEGGVIKEKRIPYTYEELLQNMVLYEGTSEKKKEKYILRKLRRTYEGYNKLSMNESRFSIIYNSGTKSECIMSSFDSYTGDTRRLESGSTEYRIRQKIVNDGMYHLEPNAFIYPEHVFKGWYMRIKNAGVWYWMMQDGSLCPSENLSKDRQKMLLHDTDEIPVIRLGNLDVIVVEAVWDKTV